MYKTIIFLVMIILLLTVIELLVKEDKYEIIFMDRRYTDRLRGIAAVIIVISHVSGLTGTRVATPLGGIGVALFLICSGYGMYLSYSKNGLTGFWKGKIKRILLPYWIGVILYHIIGLNGSAIHVRTIIQNFLLIKPIPYMWFIQYLMICNFFFWIVFSFIPEKIRLVIFFVISLVSLLCIRDDLYAEQGLSFITGLILAMQHKNKIEESKALKVGSVLLVGSIIFLGIKQFPEVRSSFYILMNIIQMFIKLLGASGILLIVWKTGAIWNKAFRLIGKCSYEVYIVHTLLLTFLECSGVTIVSMIFFLVSTGIGVIIFHAILRKLYVFNKKSIIIAEEQ